MGIKTLKDVHDLKARWKVREMSECKKEIKLQVLELNIKELQTLVDLDGFHAKWRVREMFDRMAGIGMKTFKNY